MATRVTGKLFRDFMRQRVISTSIGASRHCSSAATSAPKIPHSSKKVSFLFLSLCMKSYIFFSIVKERCLKRLCANVFFFCFSMFIFSLSIQIFKLSVNVLIGSWVLWKLWLGGLKWVLLLDQLRRMAFEKT